MEEEIENEPEITEETPKIPEEPKELETIEVPEATTVTSEKQDGFSSLESERIVLIVDEPGQRRDETVSIVEQILPNSAIDVADNPEQAQIKMDASGYDTYVINFLMPGFGASPFVKAVTNHSSKPLLMGFAADKMSDAYDPKKGIKIKPLRKLFEIEGFNEPETEDELDVAEPVEKDEDEK